MSAAPSQVDLEDGSCPTCKEGVEFERFGSDFPCPHCGVMLEPMHDCAYDFESGVEGCHDWLGLA